MNHSSQQEDKTGKCTKKRGECTSILLGMCLHTLDSHINVNKKTKTNSGFCLIWPLKNQSMSTTSKSCV